MPSNMAIGPDQSELAAFAAPDTVKPANVLIAGQKRNLYHARTLPHFMLGLTPLPLFSLYSIIDTNINPSTLIGTSIARIRTSEVYVRIVSNMCQYDTMPAIAATVPNPMALARFDQFTGFLGKLPMIVPFLGGTGTIGLCVPIAP